MNIKKTGFVSVLSFLLLVQIGNFETHSIANGQSDIGIPGWIKTTAGWWANDDIDDKSFVAGIQYLIKEGIIQISPTIQNSSGSTNEIPAWIKSNAGWWANDDLDDKSFVGGIEFLIKVGIIKIPTLNPTPHPDKDGDDIEDGSDNCPEIANASQTDLDGDNLGDACDPDIDGDNILNGTDSCPSDPENYNNFEDSDGCPDVEPLPDNSLTVINTDGIAVRTAGWGDTIITINWTYFVEHVDNSGEGFPDLGHFVVEIPGFVSEPVNTEYAGGNEFSGTKAFTDFSCSQEPILIEILSFVGDDRGNYEGDGDLIEIDVPPCRGND